MFITVLTIVSKADVQVYRIINFDPQGQYYATYDSPRNYVGRTVDTQVEPRKHYRHRP